jgi:hypothetical protein
MFRARPTSRTQRLSGHLRRFRDFLVVGNRRVTRPITDEGVVVGGAFDGDTASGMKPIAHRLAGVLASPAIVIHRQEVSPVNAVSALGAPLQSTIARLR